MKKILFISLILFSCQENSPRKFLEEKGYTQIELIENDSSCCKKINDYSASFKAINSKGKFEEGCLCGTKSSKLKNK